MNKNIVLIVCCIVVFLAVVLIANPQPKGRKHELELRVAQLELEVSNLESNVNFILSDAYVDWLLSQIE